MPFRRFEPNFHNYFYKFPENYGPPGQLRPGHQIKLPYLPKYISGCTVATVFGESLVDFTKYYFRVFPKYSKSFNMFRQSFGWVHDFMDDACLGMQFYEPEFPDIALFGRQHMQE